MCIIWVATLLSVAIFMPVPLFADSTSTHVLQNYRNNCLNATAEINNAICEVFLVGYDGRRGAPHEWTRQERCSHR